MDKSNHRPNLTPEYAQATTDRQRVVAGARYRLQSTLYPLIHDELTLRQANTMREQQRVAQISAAAVASISEAETVPGTDVTSGLPEQPTANDLLADAQRKLKEFFDDQAAA